MKKIYPILILIGLALLSSCTSNYYLCQTYTSIDIEESGKNTTIPHGRHILVKNTYKPKKHVQHGDIKGYTYSDNWTKKTKIKSKELGYLYFDFSDQTYVFRGEKYTENTPSKRVSTNRSVSTGGSVSVRGYYRKDGTYVRPHTRSAPKRSSSSYTRSSSSSRSYRR